MPKKKNKSTSPTFIVILITILILTLYNMNGGEFDLKDGISKITGKSTSNKEVAVKISEEKIYLEDKEIGIDKLNEKLAEYNKDEVVIKLIDFNGKRTVYSNVLEKLHEKNFIVIEEKE